MDDWIIYHHMATHRSYSWLTVYRVEYEGSIFIHMPEQTLAKFVQQIGKKSFQNYLDSAASAFREESETR